MHKNYGSLSQLNIQYRKARAKTKSFDFQQTFNVMMCISMTSSRSLRELYRPNKAVEATTAQQQKHNPCHSGTSLVSTHSMLSIIVLVNLNVNCFIFSFKYRETGPSLGGLPAQLSTVGKDFTNTWAFTLQLAYFPTQLHE